MQVLIPILLILLLTYLVIIRPQRRRQQQQNEMLALLREGAEVLTAGGVYGTVRSIRDDELDLEIAPGTTVKLDKRAVAMVVPEEDLEALPVAADEDA